MNSGIFIERNGILNLARVVGRAQVSPCSAEEFVVNSEAREPLDQLRSAGFVLIATVNQPALSTGQLARRDLEEMHKRLKNLLPLDDIRVCPHTEADDCPCRKPKAGLFFEAAHHWRLNLDQSFVLSDKWQDAEAAQNAGCTSILVRSPWNGHGHHDYVAANLAEAANRIMQIHKYRSQPLLEPGIESQSITSLIGAECR